MNKCSHEVLIIGTAQGEASFEIEAEDLDAALEWFSELTDEDVKNIVWSADVVDVQAEVEIRESESDSDGDGDGDGDSDSDSESDSEVETKKSKDFPWPNCDLRYQLF